MISYHIFAAMLGLLAKQRRMKTMIGAISFPEVRETTLTDFYFQINELFNM